MKARKLKLWNGNGMIASKAIVEMGLGSHEDAMRGRLHANICAHSVDDILSLFEELGMRPPSKSYLRGFFSTCWGNDMAGITPERGLWISSQHSHGCPDGGPWRVIALPAAP